MPSCSISSFSIFSTASVKSVSSLESCGNGLADEELLEAAEIPLDGRVFLSVSVPSTEVHTEPGGSQYTLYTIQVIFPCHCQEDVDVHLVVSELVNNILEYFPQQSHNACEGADAFV